MREEAIEAKNNAQPRESKGKSRKVGSNLEQENNLSLVTHLTDLRKQLVKSIAVFLSCRGIF